MCGGNLKASACSRRARVFVTPCGETPASNWAAQSRQRRTREYAQEPKPETHEYINEDGRRVTQIAGLRGNHSLDPVGSVAGVAGGYPPSNSFSPPSLRMARTATVALVDIKNKGDKRTSIPYSEFEGRCEQHVKKLSNQPRKCGTEVPQFLFPENCFKSQIWSRRAKRCVSTDCETPFQWWFDMKVVGPYRCFRDLIYGQAIGGYLLTIDAQNRVPRPSKQCAKFLPRAPIFSRSIPRFHIIPEGRDEIFEQLASKTEDIKKAKKDMTTTCWECARPKSEDVPLKWCSGCQRKNW
ncbi:hypothetical protein CPB85DRAFT_1259603 [Mucidula mucida]|nr:hypothetical protein CPB85DRAFT_1259603 [Mucidula mucida]